MSKSIESRLVALNAHLDRAVEFAQNPKDEDHTGRNLAVGAGLVGAGAGGLYLRGKAGLGQNSPLSVGQTIRRGGNLLVGKDLPAGANAAKTAFKGAKTALATQATSAGAKISAAGSKVSSAMSPLKAKIAALRK